MIRMLQFNIKTNEKGLTLVEILAAIVLISIIFISIITILNLTAKTNRTSEEIVDATYIAQKEMEFIYKLSTEDSSFSESLGYEELAKEGNWNVYRKDSEQAGYFLEIKEDKSERPMIRIVVKVFESSDEAKIDPKAQMETLLIWGDENNENSP